MLNPTGDDITFINAADRIIAVETALAQVGIFPVILHSARHCSILDNRKSIREYLHNLAIASPLSPHVYRYFTSAVCVGMVHFLRS